MRKINIILAMLLISISGLSQEKLDIQQAINITLKGNFGILVGNNNTKVAKNNTAIGNAGLLPRLDMSASSTYSDRESEMQVKSVKTQRTTNQAALNLSYTLFNGMGSIYNLDKLRNQAEGSELQTKAIVENTILQTISSFYSTATAFDNLERAKEMLKISKERLLRIKEKNRIGTESSLNLLNAEVDLNKDSVNFLNLEKKYAETKRTLNEIMGRDVNYEFNVETGTIVFKNYEINTLKEDAYNLNTNYMLAQNGITIAKYDFKIVNSTYLPKVNLNSSYGYNKIVDDFKVDIPTRNPTFTAGVTLSWNIFDGNKRKLKKKNAKIYIDNSKYRLEEQKLKLERELEDVYASYINSVKILKIEKYNLKRAELNFKQSLEYFNLGQITSTQFREAQLNLLTANNNISAVTYSAKILEAQLVKLSGKILE